jgi:hypothetical protein
MLGCGGENHQAARITRVTRVARATRVAIRADKGSHSAERVQTEDTT